MENATCRIASMLSPRTEPTTVVFRWSEDFDEYSLDEFRKACSRSLDGPASERLRELIEQFPEDSRLKTVAESRLVHVPESCTRAAQWFCDSVRDVRGTWVLAYPTKGCDIRSVAANDVRADVARWGSAASEAERLEHYQSPAVSRDCAKS